MQYRTFADSDLLEGEFREPCYIIAGVPFDGSSSYRPGSRFAPAAIRNASYNFEAYLPETGVNLLEVPIFDVGDMGEAGRVEEMLSLLSMEMEELFRRFPQAFPIFLGGEHSITPGIVREITGYYHEDSKKKLGVIYLDAHLDMRDNYLGVRDSHACAARRTAEFVGYSCIIPAGIRSFSQEEAEYLQPIIKCGRFQFYSAKSVKKKGATTVGTEIVKRLLSLGCTQIYLSIDMDVFDPSEAPGVGNPEPGGLAYPEVMAIIREAAPYLVGMDIVEVVPEYDHGMSALLASKIVRETIGLHYVSFRW